MDISSKKFEKYMKISILWGMAGSQQELRVPAWCPGCVPVPVPCWPWLGCVPSTSARGLTFPCPAGAVLLGLRSFGAAVAHLAFSQCQHCPARLCAAFPVLAALLLAPLTPGHQWFSLWISGSLKQGSLSNMSWRSCLFLALFGPGQSSFLYVILKWET